MFIERNQLSVLKGTEQYNNRFKSVFKMLEKKLAIVLNFMILNANSKLLEKL